MWPIFPDVIHFFEMWTVFLSLTYFSKSFPLSLVSAEKYLELRWLEILYFIGSIFVFTPLKLLRIGSNNNCVFLFRRLNSQLPRTRHLYPAEQKYKLLQCPLYWKIEGITFDQLTWFMKPFVCHGESDLAGIERWSANMSDRGQQKMNLTPFSSSCHPCLDQILCDAYPANSLVVILSTIFQLFNQAIYGSWSGLPH